MKPEIIIEESQRESIINRPHNLAGSVQRVLKNRYNITPLTIEYGETNIVPAVLKLFQESLDNPIDVAIKSNFKCGNQIDIKVNKSSITIKDNGYGISSAQDTNGEYVLFKAMCKYNTSSNYTSDNQGQKGVNGIGIKLCTTLSKEFKAVSDDGKKEITVIASENNLKHKVTESKSKSSGTIISFKPDFNIFEIDEIDDDHINRMFEYTLIQSLTYPEIEFKFNGKKVNYTNKKFLSLFKKEYEIFQSDDYFFAVMPNENEDFRQVSFVNGLETQRGGSHIDYLTSNIVNSLREKIQKKFKNIKPGDIKNKLQLILIAKNFKGLKWDGQTKESITNPTKDMISYFSDVDFDKIALKLFKNKEFIEPITEVYRIKEEFKKRQLLKKADKTVKKPKSEKFMPPIGNWTNIFVAEGDSASNSISKIIGRQGNGFYAMFGVPPNAYDSKMADILKSKKMNDLKNIIGLKYSETTQKNINFDNIIITTDFDLPGHFIAGQLLGLIYRFGKNLFEEHRVKRLVTPLLVAKDKKENIVAWFYTFEDYQEFQRKNKSKNYVYDYRKGLGSWDPEELNHVISTDGLDNMLEVFHLDEKAGENIDAWLGKDTQIRKDMLEGFKFNIMDA